MLKRLMSLVGGLIAAPVGVGCTKCDPSTDSRLEGRTFKARFPVEPEQTQVITGKPDLGELWAAVSFTETLKFKQLDETLETAGYETYTLGEKGEAHAGKFTMRATLRKGYTGGPPGSATELFVEVNDVRLAGKLSPPKAPPGAKALLPGQFVVRRLQEGELARLDDRYVIELPAGRNAILEFSPGSNEYENAYEFVLSVSKDGVPIQTRYDGTSWHLFETKDAGLYEIRVQQAKVRGAQEPDCYLLNVYWGEGLTIGGDLTWHKIGWRPVRSTGGSATPPANR